MENTASLVSEVFLNNDEIQWQPLALTLVEYPKGILQIYINFLIVYLMYKIVTN